MANECCFLCYLSGPAFALAAATYGASRYAIGEKIRNIATSKIRGAAVGLVEFKGKAKLDKKLISPISGTECAFYTISVRNRDTILFSFKPKKTSSFYLDDGTGKILVKTSGAEFDIGKPTIMMGFQISKDKKGKPLKLLSQQALNFLKGLDESKKSILKSFRNDPIEIRENCIAEGDGLYVLGNAEPAQNSPRSSQSHERLEIRKGIIERILLISDSHEEFVVSRLRMEAILFGLLGFSILAIYAYMYLFPNGIKL